MSEEWTNQYPIIRKNIIQLEFASYVGEAVEHLENAVRYLKEHPELTVVGTQYDYDESSILSIFCEVRS